MDNFMEQPTYKMNRGAILTQGWRRLVCRLQQYETAIGLAGSFEHLPALDKRQSSSRNPSQRGARNLFGLDKEDENLDTR
ncbi:hypothetical protein C3E97_010630 [Pseudomonas sp. MWU12-2115]|jgi:hypothetical protein|nr:hypothetical protein C3E97_010630 [Pseudomonas sp. MWU12-2115]